jgi:hypothetical protein
MSTKPVRKQEPFPKSDIHIKVHHRSHPTGVDQKAVYLHENYKIIWEAESSQVKSFEVQFVGPDLPFGPQLTKFDSTHNVSPPLPHFDELTVFKYDITITDSNNDKHQFDPHVIGGGGN